MGRRPKDQDHYLSEFYPEKPFLWAAYSVIEDEGRGYVEPPEIDQPTHSGVTLIALQEYYNRTETRPRTATVEDLKALEFDGIMDLYNEVWHRVRAPDFPAGMDYFVFDLCVHHGPRAGAMIAQRALNVVADGIIGNKTIGQAKRLSAQEYVTRVFPAMTAARLSMYRGNQFAGGLIARALKVLSRAGFRAGSTTPLAWIESPEKLLYAVAKRLESGHDASCPRSEGKRGDGRPCSCGHSALFLAVGGNGRSDVVKTFTQIYSDIATAEQGGD